MREDLEQRLRRHLPNLDAAAIPTKCEVFTICGSEARDLHDAIEEATALISAARKGQGEWREKVRQALDNWYAPWGSWKTAWWEDFASDDWEYSAENFIRALRDLLPPPPEQGE